MTKTKLKNKTNQTDNKNTHQTKCNLKGNREGGGGEGVPAAELGNDRRGRGGCTVHGAGRGGDGVGTTGAVEVGARDMGTSKHGAVVGAREPVAGGRGEGGEVNKNNPTNKQRTHRQTKTTQTTNTQTRTNMPLGAEVAYSWRNKPQLRRYAAPHPRLSNV